MIHRLKKRRVERKRATNAIYKNFITFDITLLRCRNYNIQWLQAYSNFEATKGVDVPKSFHVTSLRYAAERETDTFVFTGDLGTDFCEEYEFIEALLSNFPVMHASRGKQSDPCSWFDHE